LICGAVVFGLSVSLANQQRVGSAPPEIGFSSFAGGFAIVTCLVGAAGLWVDSIPGIVTMVMDGIAAVVYLVGGIILTSALKSVSSCTGTSDDEIIARGYNKVLNFGCPTMDSTPTPACADLMVTDSDLSADPTIPRCQRAITDYSFDFVGLALCVVMVFLGYVLARRGGSRPTVAAQI
ncbi:hypothetical protein PG997_002849, partial [Apiospora hydei]